MLEGMCGSVGSLYAGEGLSGCDCCMLDGKVVPNCVESRVFVFTACVLAVCDGDGVGDVLVS